MELNQRSDWNPRRQFIAVHQYCSRETHQADIQTHHHAHHVVDVEQGAVEPQTLRLVNPLFPVGLPTVQVSFFNNSGLRLKAHCKYNSVIVSDFPPTTNSHTSVGFG